MSLTTLTGSNNFLIEQWLHVKIRDFIKQNGHLGITRLDAEELDADFVISNLSATSLFSSNRLIVIKNLAKNKPLWDRISDILEFPLDGTDVVIVEPKIDKRGKVRAVLKAKTDFKEFADLSPFSLIDWIVSEVKDKGGQISKDTARYLIEIAGSNQQLLASEIEKLLIYQPKISENNIDLLVVASLQSDTFILIEAAFNKNRQRLISIYERHKVLKLEQVIGLLAWQLHLIAVVKAAGNKSPALIANDLGTYPSVIMKTSKLAARIDTAKVSSLITKLLVIDNKFKHQTINSEDALLYFLLSF